MTSKNYRFIRRFAFSLVALILLGAHVARAQGVEGIRVLRSDQQELIFTVTPQVSVRVLDGGLTLPRVSGATIANGSSHGAPMQLEIGIPIVVPFPSGSAVDVVGLEYDSPVKGRIAPVPVIVRDANDIAREEYHVDEALYAASRPQQATVTIDYAGIVRDVHAARVVLNPVLYDAAAGTIRSLRSATVRIRFPSSARSSRNVPLSDITRGAFINARAAAAWTLAQKPRAFTRPNAVAQARAFMRVEVKESGLYALTAEDFQRGGIDLATVDASRIAVYGSTPGGLTESRDSIVFDHNQMRQVPINVERGTNGRATRVIFYASGPYRWEINGAWDTIPVHRLSHYSFTQNYVVAVDGEPSRGYDTRPGPASFDVEPAWATSRVFFDEDKINAIDVRRVGGGSGRDWYGTEFIVDPRDRATDMRVFMTSLPGLERSAPIAYRVRVANAGHDGAATFSISQQDELLGTVGIESLGKYLRSIARGNLFVRDNANSVPSDNRSSLKIEFANNGAASGFLDYYEIHYGRRLVADNNTIAFDAPTGRGVARYRVSGFNGDDIVGFDVTDPLNPVQLERKPAGEGGVFVFHDQLASLQQPRRYFIAERSAARRVENSAKVIFGDLRGRSRDADILVITHESMRSSAQKYVDYRNSQGRLRAAFVTTEEIYTEFSSATPDATALRDYIGHAFFTWNVKPQYVILLGDASYDYRNIATTQPQLVPTYQSDDPDTFDENESRNTDDYFVSLTYTDSNIDMISGRVPVENVEQADQMVDKIIRYEANKNFATWRHTSVLSADDDVPCGEGDGFVRQSEEVLNQYMPQWMEPRKVYLPGYPTEKVPSDRKPGATADLMQFMNRGAVITNWIGHGNPKQWAHELLLERDQFIPRLSNDTALTFLVAATCNFGLFDDPAQLSGSEMFFLHPTAGAIALISSTRASYIYQNEAMIDDFFKKLFTRDADTKEFPSIGSAFLATKISGGGANDEKYHIFGDPSLRLSLPANSIVIDSVNGVDVTNGSITLGALSVVTVSGSVVDLMGRPMDGFNGTAIVTLLDAQRAASAMECGREVRWSMPGGRLFRGPAQVINGKFRTTFRVPKDISYDSTNAEIHAYAYTGETDAVGSTRNVRVFGSETTTVTDTVGPTISIFLDDRTFRSGDVVTPQPLLIVDLNDTSGINSSGSSLGHRIEAWIDGSPNAFDLTDFFQTGLTDYRLGTAERTLIGLEPGEHSVRVRAWDIFNNARVGTAIFRIAEGGESELVVSNVVNFPNPMSRETDFTFQHNQSRPLDVDIAIFTPSGRKVRTLEARSVGDRFVRIPWDGTDNDGAAMANGVYLYRIRVRVPGSDATEFEAIEKVAIVR